MSELIQTHLQDRVLTVRLNRADKKNALTQEMYSAMAEAVKGAVTNPGVRVLVFAGAPDAFCAGNDLQDFLKNPPKGDDAPVARFMRELAAFPKPVIAAVNGVAVGIGVTLMLHCDLVYVGQNARLQMPFTNIGICPEFASTYLLPRIMGHARAAELTLFGEFFTAAKALEYGLINAVLPDAEVEPHALQRAAKLAQQAPNALRVTKKLLHRWSLETVQEAIRVEADHFIPMLGQPEALEAMTAFMQKRKPDFSKFD
jgi:enoyl-CoA hydratase/carnithine racemase